MKESEEYLDRWVGGSAKGTFECPVCGRAYPHTDSTHDGDIEAVRRISHWLEVAGAERLKSRILGLLDGYRVAKVAPEAGSRPSAPAQSGEPPRAEPPTHSFLIDTVRECLTPAEAAEQSRERMREALEKVRREMQLHESVLSAVYTYLQGQPEPLPQQLAETVAEAISASEQSADAISKALEGER